LWFYWKKKHTHIMLRQINSLQHPKSKSQHTMLKERKFKDRWPEEYLEQLCVNKSLNCWIVSPKKGPLPQSQILKNAWQLGEYFDKFEQKNIKMRNNVPRNVVHWSTLGGFLLLQDEKFKKTWRYYDRDSI